MKNRFSYIFIGEYIVGNLVLKFKHTSNKDLAGQSYNTALITQALKALGKDGVDNKQRDEQNSFVQFTIIFSAILSSSFPFKLSLSA